MCHEILNMVCSYAQGLGTDSDYNKAPIEAHIDGCVSALIKMVGGAWRRPRMKVYDYNQEFGGNYYQVSIVCSIVQFASFPCEYCSF